MIKPSHPLTHTLDFRLHTKAFSHPFSSLRRVFFEAALDEDPEAALHERLEAALEEHPEPALRDHPEAALRSII